LPVGTTTSATASAPAKTTDYQKSDSLIKLIDESSLPNPAVIPNDRYY
jgi:hypothetical protein